jgi:hypothetical protein
LKEELFILLSGIYSEAILITKRLYKTVPQKHKLEAKGSHIFGLNGKAKMNIKDKVAPQLIMIIQTKIKTIHRIRFGLLSEFIFEEIYKRMIEINVHSKKTEIVKKGLKGVLKA